MKMEVISNNYQDGGQSCQCLQLHADLSTLALDVSFLVKYMAYINCLAGDQNQTTAVSYTIAVAILDS